MPWTLTVYNPTGSEVKAIYDLDSPGGIVEGFIWQRRGDGTPLQLRFKGVPDLLAIDPRDIVHLRVDGVSSFYGPIVRMPSSGREIGEYVAVGAYRLMADAVMDTTRYQNQPVEAVARDIVSRLRHPAVKYDPARINAPAVLSEFYAPYVALDRLLDALAKSAGVTWGTDADGYLWFGTPTGVVTVGYQEGDLQWLPVEGDEVVTAVSLIYGDYAYRYEAPEHAIYRAEKAYLIPDLLNIFDEAIPLSGTYNGHNLRLLDGTRVSSVHSALLRDWDRETGYIIELPPNNDNDLWPWWWGIGYYYGNPPSEPLFVIADFDVYRLDGGAATPVVIVNYKSLYGRTEFVTWIKYDYKEGIQIQFPSDAQYDARVMVGLIVDGPRVPYRVIVRELRILKPGRRLENYAKSLIWLPYRRPSQITLPRIVPPAPTVIIAGTPSGDVTGPAQQYEYEYTTQRIATTIRVGASGLGEDAKAIQILAKDIVRRAEDDLRLYMKR